MHKELQAQSVLTKNNITTTTIAIPTITIIVIKMIIKESKLTNQEGGAASRNGA